jgi:molecular chaperone GrpE
MTDERLRRAEELMAERARSHGATNGPSDPSKSAMNDEPDQESLKAALQRERADFANYRRRNEAERSDYARFAKMELITKLLEVLDNFDRALDTVPAQLRNEPWVEGIWLVERKLRDILASEGLEEMDSVGQPFDPHIHEALGHVDSSAPEGTVVDEVRKAYKLHDKIIRPALVTVARGPSRGEEE